MLTRGKLIGEIMDGLGQLNFVLQTRSKLGLYDLNKFCEDFVKDLLNMLYDYNLINLNETRSNEPGLDLGDEVNRLGIQVTTDKSSAKINHTLEKITPDQQARYNRFVILILGAKQGRYDSINPDLAAKLHFEVKDHIWDFGDLERDIVTSSLEKIKDVYDFFQSNLIRVFSDLDVGTTPSGESTSILDQLEPRPDHRYHGCGSLIAYINEKYSVDVKPEDKNPAYRKLYTQLSELPKITREFYYAVLSKSEYVPSRETYGVRETLLRRFLNIPSKSFKEEIMLLEAYGLAKYYELHESDYWIMLQAIFENELCLPDMIDYIRDMGYDLKQVFVDLDFTCLR